ncbi:hypothetical protein OUZ56_019248 [Daphnia magna]|uniref:Uncharacterized protein n=1 Tax=Daphnia magna TaxID=35525 RepID=A0ABQ9ZB22_9CRUS|nr:hypothetical protein OUZ56_019248 [Daphnia magna]
MFMYMYKIWLSSGFSLTFEEKMCYFFYCKRFIDPTHVLNPFVLSTWKVISMSFARVAEFLFIKCVSVLFVIPLHCFFCFFVFLNCCPVTDRRFTNSIPVISSLLPRNSPLPHPFF